MNKFSKVFAVAILCSSVGLSAGWIFDSAAEKLAKAQAAAQAQHDAINAKVKPDTTAQDVWDAAIKDEHKAISDNLATLQGAVQAEANYKALPATEKAKEFAKARWSNVKSLAWNWDLVAVNNQEGKVAYFGKQFVNKVIVHAGLPVVAAVAVYKMRQNSVRAAADEADDFEDEEDFEVAN